MNLLLPEVVCGFLFGCFGFSWWEGKKGALALNTKIMSEYILYFLFSVPTALTDCIVQAAYTTEQEFEG